MRLPKPRPFTRTDKIGVAVGVVIAILVLVIGLSWLSGIRVQWDWQKPLATALIVAGALGILAGVGLSRFWRIPGAILSVIALAATVITVPIVVEELRVGAFSESQRRPTASAEQVPDRAEPEPTDPAPLADPDLAIADLDVAVEVIADGFEQSMAVRHIPGTRDLLVAERAGKVFTMTNDGEVDGEPILNLGGETDTDGERGLQDIAFNPAGDRLYVSFTDLAGDNQISSWVFADGQVDLATRLDVITVQQPYETHNGGGISFGADGYLYIGVGDGGRLRDPIMVGQDRSSRLATILRILPDEVEGDYLIPPDNPYLDEDDVWPDIYAYGARNPFRFSFDPATGDLWIGDVGQAEFEEVHYLPADHSGGANFGWRFMVADQVYVGPDFDPTGYTEEIRPDDHVPPIWFYAQDESGPRGARNAITGGRIYRGSAIPELYGAYLYGDFNASVVGVVVFDENLEYVEDDVLEFEEPVPVPVSFNLDADGEILIVSLGGSISRLVPG